VISIYDQNMKSTSLYKPDGTLCPQAQILVNCKPDYITTGEWIRAQKRFRKQLSPNEQKEFAKLRNKIHQSKYRTNNPDKIKFRSFDYHRKNKEKIRQRKREWRKSKPNYSKEYYGRNPETIKRINSRWRANNPEKSRQVQLNYLNNNPDYLAKYTRNRRRRDPHYRFVCSLRAQCNRVVKQLALGNKPTNTFRWVGCSPEKLKEHFESLFSEGMCWENYGHWHIDHVRPVCSFQPDEWESINHYTNLQPLWANDNIQKGGKWN